MISNLQTNSNSKVAFKNIVLLASGYNQEWVRAIYEVADSFGEELAFVGISRTAFLNQNGNSITGSIPSYLLSEILETFIPKLLIIPDGKPCFMQLFVDPRVHCLISKTASSRGKIALAADAQLALPCLPPQFRVPHSHFYFQKNLGPSEFARQMFAR
ncbi:MAG: hypothetical protein AB8G95_04245 [Anaerolineae bacterium]